MEYYYCPSLLKLLQYLWVSVGLDRCPLSSSSSSSSCPPSLNLPSLYVPSFLLGLAASSGSDLGEKWLLIRGRAFGEGRESSVAGEGQSVEKGAESRLGE